MIDPPANEITKPTSVSVTNPTMFILGAKKAQLTRFLNIEVVRKKKPCSDSL